MMGIKTSLIAAALSGTLAFSSGWKLGHVRGESAGDREVQELKETATGIMRRLKAERDQCHGQVGKWNDSVEDMRASLERQLERIDGSTRLAAEQSRRAADRALRQSEQAATAALNLQERIGDVADECARAGVSDDSVGLLRDIAAAAADD